MSNETTTISQETRNYRLPTDVIPVRYRIKLTPDLEKFTFEGEETIELDIHNGTKEIVLNAANIDIKNASIVENQNTNVGKVAFNTEAQQAIISFQDPLTPGNKTLKLVFSGILNDKLHGFYRSFYHDSQATKKTLAVTQFESTDARQAFPCWDEPEYKAIFDITLVIDENLTAISNASIKSEINIGEGKKEVIFNATMKMSTYLVAFIVGELEASESVLVGSTPIRIWSIKGKKHLSSFARDCAESVLTFFNKYYGINYPSDKLDLIAIPDFASGAMENLGAITFRETALLVDVKTASHAELERIADVVAHEIAHMWFGDLVTMKWWNGIWLNEAFATFMEILAVDNWKPQWKRWDTFSAFRAAAFAIDGLLSTRPIEFPVKHPDEAAAMFDILTYEKGASVLRMLEQYLGVEEFRQGIHKYLEQHKFSNTETSDLWDALETSSKLPVRTIMDSWIFQGGYPLVSVELDDTTNNIILRQERFLYNPDNTAQELYQVPIIVRTKTAQGEVIKKIILEGKEAQISMSARVEWLIVNAGGHGFYRTRYSSTLLKAFTSSLQEIATPIERFSLVSDTWAATLAGHTRLKEYISLISLFKEERDKNVWTAIIGSLQYLERIVDISDRPNLERFVRELTEIIYQDLNWTPKFGETELTTQLRGMIISTLGTIGNDPEVQQTALEYYQKYTSDKLSVNSDVMSAIINILAHVGDAARYQEFFQHFKNAQTPQEEHKFLLALSGFRKPDLIDTTLRYTMSGDVRTQDAPYLIRAMFSNVEARTRAWDFLTTNWNKLLEVYPPNTIPRMCDGVTCLAVNTNLEKQVNDFFAKHPVPQGGKTIDQHLERLHIAVEFKQREGAYLASIFG